tara:strand:- start:1459 stop:2472 length:1014 start_codon:yes stop_codon:yes gene_type:complete
LSNDTVILTEAEGRVAEEGGEWESCLKVDIFVGNAAGGKLPVSIPPKGAVEMKAQLFVEVPEKKARVFDVAWKAMQKRVIMELTFKDAEDRETTVVNMFANRRSVLKAKRDDSEKFWLFLDDPSEFSRTSMTVKLADKSNPQKGIHVSVPGRGYDYALSDMRRLVYKAKESKESRVSLEWGSDKFSGYAWVDVHSNRVYAIEVKGKSDTSEAVGVYAVPDYTLEAEGGGGDKKQKGETETSVEPCAAEKEISDGLTGWTEVSQDDAIPFLPYAISSDDGFEKYKPPAPKSSESAPSLSGSAGSAEVMEAIGKMNNKLDMILMRLGDLELRVRMLSEK